MMRRSWLAPLIALVAPALLAQAPAQPRARDLGVPFDGTPGRYNAITDVAGVEVGEVTLISGSGKRVVGKGPVRTGVTAIMPRGHLRGDTVFAGWFTLNGNGEMTGTTWIEESGMLEGPVLITNTFSVGTVRDATLEWSITGGRNYDYELPVVGETLDNSLNDVAGFHVTKKDVFAALDGARGGPVPEGNVGGGTGMICGEFKGGTGTASRKLSAADGGYTVGVLVQCNYGLRHLLRIAGVPVGQEIPDLLPCYDTRDSLPGGERWGRCEHPRGATKDQGSIIIVVATDAPLLPHQLKRIAKRASLGIARDGGIGANTSGDIFVAFSTANNTFRPDSVATVAMLSNDLISPLFEATVQAVEEAIVNALVAARTMEGADHLRVTALPHDRLQSLLKKYNRYKQR
jgi:D-aminopeptidase